MKKQRRSLLISQRALLLKERSTFVHFYARERNAYAALRKAVVFAAYKIGEKGAAEGFLTEAALLERCRVASQEAN